MFAPSLTHSCSIPQATQCVWKGNAMETAVAQKCIIKKKKGEEIIWYLSNAASPEHQASLDARLHLLRQMLHVGLKTQSEASHQTGAMAACDLHEQPIQPQITRLRLYTPREQRSAG